MQPGLWWLVRHGEVDGAAGLCYGRTDLRLKPGEARRVAHAIALQCNPTSAASVWVLHSDSERCAAAAAELRVLRPVWRFESSVDLREMDFGAWEGRTWLDIGECALSAWTRDFWAHRCGGGESVGDVMQRVTRQVLACRAAWSAGQTVIWLTHAGVVRAMQLLEQGVRRTDCAAQWPQRAIPYGEPQAWRPPDTSLLSG